MRYFYDFEFSETGRTIEPISLGLVADTGSELYIEFDFDEQRVRDTNPWVTENVLPLLDRDPRQRLCFKEATEKIVAFVGVDVVPQLWGYYADYDHVAWCWLWGTMIELPSHFPMYTRDLKQLHWHLGSPKDLVPPKTCATHNALADARWNKLFYAAMLPLALTKGIVV